MVTADAAAETVRPALGAGALNFLVKPFGQEQIDAAMAQLREADRPPTPKGRSPVTARLVRDALEASTVAVTAAGLATELGSARAAAHRYLSALVEEGRALMRLAVRHDGAPEHEYVWRR
jgi:response regulator of citrate/malate metabolism